MKQGKESDRATLQWLGRVSGKKKIYCITGDCPDSIESRQYFIRTDFPGDRGCGNGRKPKQSESLDFTVYSFGYLSGFHGSM